MMENKEKPLSEEILENVYEIEIGGKTFGVIDVKKNFLNVKQAVERLKEFINRLGEKQQIDIHTYVILKEIDKIFGEFK